MVWRSARKLQRAKVRSQPLRFDYIGLGVLALVLSCWEVILSKGQEWDWLGDPFWRMHALIAGFTIGMLVFVVWELNNPAPIVNLRVATSENWRDKATGERRERTEWHRVVIFNENLAKIAEQYLKKGSKVYLEGQLQTRKWQDQSGQDR